MSLLLSIIVPIYNAERYLYNNILSIFNQKEDTGNFEVVLVNDGSTDDSEKVCLKLQEKYKQIKYIYQENNGVSSARNKGLEEAEGKYICFLDCDDFVADNYIETILSVIQDNDFIILNNYIVNGKKIYKEKEKLLSKFRGQVKKDSIIELICENKFNAPWDKVYVKEIIDNNNIKFKNGLNMGEDLLFNLEYVYYCNKIFITDKSVYYHTINIDSLCNKKITLKRFEEYNIIYNEMINRINYYDKNLLYTEKINLAFLRNIANYSGKLYKSGYKKKEIQKIFNENQMINNIVNVNTKNVKDYFRQILVKKSMYNICSILFNS